MKYSIYILFIFSLFSCEEQSDKSNAVARVYNIYLYEEDLREKMPTDLSREDSILYRRSTINAWAMEQLLLKKAKLNIGDKNEEIRSLIDKYEKELLIDKYKQAVVQQELDTIFSEDDIEEYYQNNKAVFRLNESLVQLKYIHIDKDINDEDEIIRLFKSNKKEDINELIDRELEFNSFNFNDSIWISQNDVIKKLPFLKAESKLKKNKFMQKEDSLGVYLLKINNLLYRNDIAPKSYVISSIKRMILHKRKLELAEIMERTLVSDAIEKKQFELYNND
jgi:hypothetical protein